MSVTFYIFGCPCLHISVHCCSSLRNDAHSSMSNVGKYLVRESYCNIYVGHILHLRMSISVHICIFQHIAVHRWETMHILRCYGCHRYSMMSSNILVHVAVCGTLWFGRTVYVGVLWHKRLVNGCRWAKRRCILPTDNSKGWFCTAIFRSLFIQNICALYTMQKWTSSVKLKLLLHLAVSKQLISMHSCIFDIHSSLKPFRVVLLESHYSLCLLSSDCYPFHDFICSVIWAVLFVHCSGSTVL